MSWQRLALMLDAVAGVFLWLMVMLGLGHLHTLTWSALALGGLLILAGGVYLGDQWLQTHDL